MTYLHLEACRLYPGFGDGRIVISCFIYDISIVSSVLVYVFISCGIYNGGFHRYEIKIEIQEM